MVNIHKEVYGHGEPIVLIHGWAMHSGIWRTFAQQLAIHYQVICLDLPGHGLSESVSPYTLEQISKALIECVPDTVFTLLGWSLGASVALSMAKRYPQRVNSLIIVAGNPHFVQSDDWPGMRADVLNNFANELSNDCQSTLLRFLGLQVKNLSNRKVILKRLKLSINEQKPPKNEALQGGLAILSYVDMRDVLPSLKCPMNIIQGDKDTLVPVQACLAIQKLYPVAEVNIIVGAGHVPFLSHQSEMIELIREFI